MTIPTRLKPTPAQMVSAIAAGDPGMESTFCEHYYRSIFNILRGYTQDAFRAEDMTQEALLAVLVKLRANALHQPERLTSFVHQTARYLFIGWYRQARRLQFCGSMDDRREAGYSGNGEAACLTREQSRLVTRLIEQLDVTRDRELLLRAYLYDEPKQSICESLMLTTEHFDRVISRARRRFRKLVEQQDDDTQMALADEPYKSMPDSFEAIAFHSSIGSSSPMVAIHSSSL